MKKNANIAVFFDNSRKYDRDIMRGIAKFIAENPDWRTYLLAPRYIKPSVHKSIYENLTNWKPDGAIVRMYPGWVFLKKQHIPLILSPIEKIASGEINIVGNDEKIGEMAARYYIEKGFKHYCYYGDDRFHWSKKRKLSFFKQIKQTASLSFSEVPNTINQTAWVQRSEKLAFWLLKQPVPLAIFCATDEFAHICIDAIRYAGLKCPENIAVMGVDNDDSICDITNPTLTSIDQGGERVGYLAAKMLQQVLSGENKNSSNLVLPPKEIVERQSTAIIASNDSEIQKAITFISENCYYRKINVNHVVAATNLSRRVLEKRFRKATGKSILVYIQQNRVTKIKRLLSETSLSIKEIAIQMDFTNLESISRFFKKSTGLSPIEYRKKFNM